MAELRAFEYRVLKYVPNPMQAGTYIGVLLMELGATGDAYADVLLTNDWIVARTLDPFIELDVLEAFAQELREGLRSSVPDRSKGGEAVSRQAWVLHVLEDWFSNAIQVTAPSALMTNDPASALRGLVRMHCERANAQGAVRVARGRTAILSEMRRAFDEYGVFHLLSKQIAVAEYTRAGDRLKIDYGYRYPSIPHEALSREDQVFRMFHAVSLRHDAGSAEMLALKFGEFRPRLEEKQKSRVELTAVTEAGLDGEDDSVKFAMDTFREKGVIVADVSQMAGIADRARRELAA